VSLLGAIDLFSGRVHGLVRNRHRSCEFIEMLQHLDSFYSKEMTIRIINGPSIFTQPQGQLERGINSTPLKISR
ncbi:MAG: hypothetical protein ACREOI_06285, partial [bacterium]